MDVLVALGGLMLGTFGLDVLIPLSWLIVGKFGFDILVMLSWLMFGNIGLDILVITVGLIGVLRAKLIRPSTFALVQFWKIEL